MTSLECQPWRAPMRAVRLTVLVACGATWALSPQSAVAASCSFTSVATVNFGTYDVFATSPNNGGVGGLSIRCTGVGAGASFPVTLSTGQSNSYASRVMKSGTDQLNYNLYTTPQRTTVWGDGSGGSSVQTVNQNGTTTYSIYGQIPPGQDVGVGTYTDSITATVTF